MGRGRYPERPAPQPHRARPSHSARGQPSNKRLKLAGRTRVKESECLRPADLRISFIHGAGGGPRLPAA